MPDNDIRRKLEELTRPPIIGDIPSKPEKEREEKKGIVLLVDDEPNVLKMYERAISEAGYEVITALSIDDVLKKLSSPGKTMPEVGHEIDFGVFDIRLLDGRGDQLREQLLEKGWGFGVGLYSGYPDEIGRVQIGKLNTVFILPKRGSETPYEIVRHMESYLAQTALHREILKRSIPAALERRRLRAQVEILQTQQGAMLPKESIKIGEYSICGITKPVDDKVGGDFWTVHQWQTEKGITNIGLIVADGCGHGLSAVSYPALVFGHYTGHHSLLSTLRRIETPKGYMKAFNDCLKGKIPDDSSLVALYGILDPIANTFSYTLAGAEPPIISNKDGVRMVEAPEGIGGAPLGISQEEDYLPHTLNIQKGDRIFFITDGFGDSQEKGSERFLRETGVASFIEPYVKKPVEEIVKSIFVALEQKYKRTDDITLVVIARD